ncbi:MAG: hypothetical protein ABGU93_10875 [Acetobacterium sp.]|uniref:hypothetical protein n=1 Tax=Acetobacterium sp. TaxID=1872094 RepID=UPI003242947A
MKTSSKVQRLMKRKIYRFTIGSMEKLSYKEQGGLPVKMKESYNLEFKEEISRTFLKTVSAYANYNDGYYNLAGELLADHNEISFSGIDVVKFGKDISQIQFRKTITNRSLLTQFDMAIELFEQYYIFEEIDGYNRANI